MTDGERVVRVRLALLGGFVAERAGQVVPNSAWSRRSARSLVALLAVTPGHRLHREQVEDLLWPEGEAPGTYEGFRKALRVARHVLEPDLPPKGTSSYLAVSDDMVTLVPDHVWIDADHFEQLAALARGSSDTAAYENALAAYLGDLLPDERYADWAVERREALARLHRDLLLELAALLERRGAWGGAIERLRQALARDPADEDAHRHLIRLYALGGSRHLALRQYQACVAALRQELDAIPAPDTQALYRQIVDGSLHSTAHGGGTPEEEERPALPAAVHRVAETALIGRARAVDLLLAQLHQAAEGRGSLALVSGEAGIGKSRLLAEVAREAVRRGAIVLWGTCFEQEGAVAYGPFVAALDEYLLTRPPAQRIALATDYPELGRLIPSLLHGRTLGIRGAMSPTKRTRLLAAVVRLLTELAAMRPLLLIIDDLHAADPATLHLLQHLAAAATQRCWIVVGAFREEEVPPDSTLRRIVKRLVRDGMCQHIDLLRLARQDCDQLVQNLLDGGAVEPEVLEEVYRLSLGNPLFVRELVRSMQGDLSLALKDARWCLVRMQERPVPRGVRDVVWGRVTRMARPVRQALDLAAVAGMYAAFTTLRAVTEVQDAELLDALDQALKGGILEEREDGYAFCHPLFRSALYERISKPRRVFLHGAVARAIEESRPQEVEALAFHYVRSETHDKAIGFLRDAGRRAFLVHAFVVAEGYFREALVLLRGTGATSNEQAHQEPQLRVHLGETLIGQARYDDALAELEQAERLSEMRDDRETCAHVAALIGRAYWLRGAPSAGVRVLETVITWADHDGRVSKRAQAELHTALMHCVYTLGNHERQLEVAYRAADLARTCGDEGLALEADVGAGSALQLIGRWEEARKSLELSVARAEATGDLDTLWRALGLLSEVYGDAGLWAQCRVYRERGLAIAERIGDPARIASTTSNLGGVLQYTGEWNLARACYLKATAIFATLGPSRFTPYPLSGLAYLSWRTGDRTKALEYLDETENLARQTGNIEVQRYCQVMRGRMDLDEGRAQEVLTRLAAFYRDEHVSTFAVTELRPLEVEAHHQLGQNDVAMGLADDAIVQARRSNQEVALVSLMRCKARILIDLERWEEARCLLHEALDIAQRHSFRDEEARALVNQAALQGRVGAREDERKLLESALVIYREMGDRVGEAQVHAVLQRSLV